MVVLIVFLLIRGGLLIGALDVLQLPSESKDLSARDDPELDRELESFHIFWSERRCADNV